MIQFVGGLLSVKMKFRSQALSVRRGTCLADGGKEEALGGRPH